MAQNILGVVIKIDYPIGKKDHEGKRDGGGASYEEIQPFHHHPTRGIKSYLPHRLGRLFFLSPEHTYTHIYNRHTKIMITPVIIFNDLASMCCDNASVSYKLGVIYAFGNGGGVFAGPMVCAGS